MDYSYSKLTRSSITGGGKSMGFVGIACLFILLTGCAENRTVTTSAGNWPNWRGPTGTGTAEEVRPPVRWSETENVVWKVPIPGRGSSSPVVWEDRV